MFVLKKDKRTKECFQEHKIKHAIEKAYKWIKANTEGGVHPSSTYGFVEKFKKAMEE